MVGKAFHNAPMPPRLPRARTTTRRLALLVACLAAGGFIAWLGHRLSGDATWVLAVPAALAAGWWTVADPTRCRRDR